MSKKVKKSFICLFICIMSVFMTITVKPEEVKAETDILTDEYNYECFKKIVNFMEKYVDPEYHRGSYENIGRTEEESNELRQVALEVVKDCETQYEKIKAITIFVADRTYYDYYGFATSAYTDAYDVYKEQRTVCEGYANLVKALCNAVDIPCMYLGGFNHAYNAAYDDDNGRWVFADATWCSKTAIR